MWQMPISFFLPLHMNVDVDVDVDAKFYVQTCVG